jgi:hypothetical protein
MADAGYSSSEALQALEDNNVAGYMPNFGQYKPSREGFSYDATNDRYTVQEVFTCLSKKYKPTALVIK